MLQLFDRRPRLIVFLAVLLASLRIASTYPVFSHTADEPVHLACGLEWLEKHTYTFEAQHPPLARVAAALGPYLEGARIHAAGQPLYVGLSSLYFDNRYEQYLMSARIAILPFFWIACAAVYAWGVRALGRAGAVIATILFTLIPPVLAHAGLATTDMALTAFLLAALVAGLAWAERPSMMRSLIFGVLGGLALVSKLSSLVFGGAFVVAAAVVALAVERPRPGDLIRWIGRRAMTLPIAAGAAFLLVWAMYRFSFGQAPYLSMAVPFPEFYWGIEQVRLHNQGGHAAFLLGTISRTGFLLYYPVVLAIKTPIGLLMAAGLGAVVIARRRLSLATMLPAVFGLVMLGVGFSSRINIGVRHILPIYASIAIVAAAGILWLAERWDQPMARWALIAVTGWTVLSGALQHPDYLAYTNELAGNEPERILVDSDLDWGQDINRLGQRLRQLGVKQLSFSPVVEAYLEGYHGFPPVMPSDPEKPSPGWNAVSPTVWKAQRMGLYFTRPEVVPWPDRMGPPTERVGRSILLWYVPPPPGHP